jgi:hypothetical protein
VRTPYGREGVSEDMVKEISLTGTMDQEKGEGERRGEKSILLFEGIHYIYRISGGAWIPCLPFAFSTRQIGLAGVSESLAKPFTTPPVNA